MARPLRTALFAMVLVMLSSCGKPPPLSRAEDERIDRAMEHVKAEQNRTDRAENIKRSEALAELRQEKLGQEVSVIEVAARPIPTNAPRQHFPADNRPQRSPDRAVAPPVSSDRGQ